MKKNVPFKRDSNSSNSNKLVSGQKSPIIVQALKNKVEPKPLPKTFNASDSFSQFAPEQS